MTNTEIQAINIGTTQASALYIGTTQIWSGSTPVPPLPDNMERKEFIPADIYEEHGDIIQPIDVTLGNIRVYSVDNNTYVNGYMFYVPNTDPTDSRYWLCVSTPRSWYVYSIEIEFDGGTEDYVGGNSGSNYSFDTVGTYTISNNKLTWNWDSSNPVRFVNFFNVADPDEYGQVALEITKITAVVAQQTVSSLNQPVISSVDNGNNSTALVTITSGNAGVNTEIKYKLNDVPTAYDYSQPFNASYGTVIYAWETYTEYPFSTIQSSRTSYTVPTPVTPASSGEYVFNCSDDTPIADRQQYTVTRGNVSMTVSDGLIYLDQHYRIYAAQTITFSAGGSTMSHIEFDFISGYANNSSTVLSADSGTCANNYATDLTGEWNGSATSVTITTSKQIRVPEFRVTVD